MNRRFLTYIIASIAAVGLVIAAIPFIQSWRPSETAAANRVVLELDEFAPATYQVIAGRNARLYILHFPLGAYSGDGDRRFRFLVTGLARGEVLDVDDNSVGHDGCFVGTGFGFLGGAA